MVSSLVSITYEPNYCGLWAMVYGLTYWVNWTNYANKLCLTTKWSHIMYKHTIMTSFTYTYPYKVFQQVWLCLRNIHSHSIKITKNTYYHPTVEEKYSYHIVYVVLLRSVLYHSSLSSMFLGILYNIISSKLSEQLFICCPILFTTWSNKLTSFLTERLSLPPASPLFSKCCLYVPSSQCIKSQGELNGFSVTC